MSNVRAFLSHNRRGSLYNLSNLVTKIDEFTYNLADDARFVMFNNRLLYSVMESNVCVLHTYTSRRLLHTSADEGLEVLPESLWLGNDPLRPAQ